MWQIHWSWSHQNQVSFIQRWPLLMWIWCIPKLFLDVFMEASSRTKEMDNGKQSKLLLETRAAFHTHFKSLYLKYKIHKAYINVYINGNQGQWAALFLLAHVTSANISKMLLIFRQRNVISEATKVIFTDKDFSEREAIRQIFPHVNLLLCFFHTLKTFRSKMTNCY